MIVQLISECAFRSAGIPNRVNLGNDNTFDYTFYLPGTYIIFVTWYDADNQEIPSGTGYALQCWITVTENPDTTVSNPLTAKVDEVVAAEKVENDDWQTALNLHDWLTNNAYYDYNYQYYGAEGVLLNHTGVCNSYARAYILLCEKAGIPVRRVTGDAGESHAWNAIQLDGNWYHVDVTWDDPGKSTELVSGSESHDYFCLNDDLIGLDHTNDGKIFAAGQCSSLAANWLVRTGDMNEMGDHTVGDEGLCYSYYSGQISALLNEGETEFTVDCGDVYIVITRSDDQGTHYSTISANSTMAVRGWTALAYVLSRETVLNNQVTVSVSVTYDKTNNRFSCVNETAAACTEHDWTNHDGFCALCGAQCPHDGGFTVEDERHICSICGWECTHPSCSWNERWSDDTSITPANDRCHHIIGMRISELVCEICGYADPAFTTTYDVDSDYDHSYCYSMVADEESPVCSVCQHVNACEHNGDSCDTYEWEEEPSYVSIDNKSHSRSGSVTFYTVCSTCGIYTASQPGQPWTETVPHSYNEQEGGNPVCGLCGHENDCTHEHTHTVSYIQDYEHVTYMPEPDDNQYHSVIGTGYTQEWCDDCGMMINQEDNVQVTRTEEHRYTDGVCSNCNHVCTHAFDSAGYCPYCYSYCQHTNMETEYTEKTETGPFYVCDPDDPTRHLVYGNRTVSSKVCPDCHQIEYNSEYEMVYGDPQEPAAHVYTAESSGYCTLCGSYCQHPGIEETALLERTPEERQLISFDDQYHGYAYVKEYYRICPICGAEIGYGREIITDDFDPDSEEARKAAHDWNDGYCQQCGYNCDHHYTDGVCEKCGYHCPHWSYTEGCCDTCGYQCPHPEEHVTTVTGSSDLIYEWVSETQHVALMISDLYEHCDLCDYSYDQRQIADDLGYESHEDEDEDDICDICGLSISGVCVWTYSGQAGVARVSGNGVLRAPYEAELPADKRAEVKRIIIEGTFAAVNADAFDGMGSAANPVRIDFMQRAKPDLGTDPENNTEDLAIAGKPVICRYYSQDHSWTDNDLENDPWVYLPVFSPDQETMSQLNWRGHDGEWIATTSLDVGHDLYTLNAEQAYELTFTGRSVVMFGMPSEDDLKLLTDHWDTTWLVSFQVGEYGAQTAEWTLPANTHGGIEFDLCAPDLKISLDASQMEESVGRLMIVAGEVGFAGIARELYLRDTMTGETCDVTVTGTIGSLNYIDLGNERAFHGSLKMKGIIEAGTIYGTNSIVIPGVSDANPNEPKPVIFNDMPMKSISSPGLVIGADSEEPVEVVSQTEGWLIDEDEGIISTNLGLEDYSLRYDLLNEKWEVSLRPRDTTQSGYGTEIVEIAQYNPDFTVADIIWADDTDLYICDMNGTTAPLVIASQTDENDQPLAGGPGLRTLHLEGVTADVYCPVYWMVAEQLNRVAQITTHVTIHDQVDDLSLELRRNGNTITVAEGGRVGQGSWSRFFNEPRYFGEVNGYCEVLTDNHLNVMSWKSGESLHALLPGDAEITGKTKTKLTEGQTAVADIGEADIGELTTAEYFALANYLKDPANGGAPAVIFDASITAYNVNEEGVLTQAGSITELDEGKNLSFTVSNNVENAYILRLHEENGTMTADMLPDQDQNNETLTFESNLFSKYVIIDPAGEMQEDWDYEYSEQTHVLQITGDGMIPDYPDENSQAAPWAQHADEIERIIIGSGIRSIGANAFANMGNMVRIDFLGNTAPIIDEDAFAGSTVICRHYTADESWPADTGYLNGEHTVSWFTLPVYDPVTEGLHSIYYASDTGWVYKEYDGAPATPLDAEHAKEFTFNGRSIYLDDNPSLDEFGILVSNDWHNVYSLIFRGSCSGEFELDVPVLDNPIIMVWNAAKNLHLIVNVTDGGKVDLRVGGGQVTCNGNVYRLTMELRNETDGGQTEINGDVDVLFIEKGLSEEAYYGSLTVNGTVRSGRVYGDEDVKVLKSSDSSEHFEHVIIAEIPEICQNTPIISDGELHVTLQQGAGWEKYYAIAYNIDDIAHEYTVYLDPKDETLSDSTVIKQLDFLSADDIIYGNTNLNIFSYTRDEQLQISGDTDEQGNPLGLRRLTIQNASVQIDCDVDYLSTAETAYDWYDMTINGRIGFIWFGGTNSRNIITIGEGGFVENGVYARIFRDDLHFSNVSGACAFYSNGQMHVPCYKYGQTISFILPSDSSVTEAVGYSAVMDLDQTNVLETERELIELNEGERITGAVDVNIFEESDGTLGSAIHDVLDDPVEVAVTASAGTRVIRLHEEADGTISATAINTTPGNDGTILFESDRFSKFVLVNSDTWGWEYEAGEQLLRITGSGPVEVDGVAPWINSEYDIDRVMVGEGITEIGANVFAGLKNRVRIDFCETVMPIIMEDAFGDTSAVCRYTSKDESWNNHSVSQNLTWAWMPTFNFQAAGTFGSLWYEKDTNNPGWSVKVEADNRTYCDMSPETAHEVLLYCTDLFLADVPSTEELTTVIGNTETENWVLHIGSAYNGVLILNGEGEDSIACAILPRELDVYSSNATVNVTDSREEGIDRLEVQNGKVNYTGNVKTLVLFNSDEEGFANVTVAGTIDELALYTSEGRPYRGNMILSGTGNAIRTGYVYGDGTVTMEIPGVTAAYPISGGSPTQSFENLTVQDPETLIEVLNTNNDPIVTEAAGLDTADPPTIDQFRLRYVIGGSISWLTLTPKAEAGIGSECIDIAIDGDPNAIIPGSGNENTENPEDTGEPEPTSVYNADFLNNLTDYIIWGNDTDICITGQRPQGANNSGNGEGEDAGFLLTGKDGKGINEFSATGWCKATVQCTVNQLQLQPDPGTFGNLNLIFENKVNSAYIQPNNCDLNITLRNGGSINGGRWKQLLRDYRNFGAHEATEGTLKLVDDSALTVMSYTDWESLGSILPSDNIVSEAVGEKAMATLTQTDSVMSEALDSVDDGTETPLKVESWQIVSTFDVSVNKYTLNSDGTAEEGDPVHTQLSEPIPVTISSDEDMPNAFIVRLHEEENGTVTATKLATTDFGNAKRFSSDLFSDYVLVNPDAEPEGLIWNLSEDGVLTISGNGEMADYDGDEPAPWSEYSSEIRTVVIEEGVTGIGDCAFYECENLTTVTMADSVTRIGIEAFERCAVLADIQLSNGLETIGPAAFSQCYELTSITLPRGLEGIGSAAFADSGITSVAVAEGVETKPWDFFCPDKNWNKHLYHINLPNSVKDVGYGAFSYTELPYEDPDFTIPSALTTIESEAFSGTSMRFVWLPENLESIGSAAFADCPNLEYVYIPDSCDSIEPGAFPAGTTILGISGYDSSCSAETYANTNGYTYVNYEDPFAGNG